LAASVVVGGRNCRTAAYDLNDTGVRQSNITFTSRRTLLAAGERSPTNRDRAASLNHRGSCNYEWPPRRPFPQHPNRSLEMTVEMMFFG